MDVMDTGSGLVSIPPMYSTTGASVPQSYAQQQGQGQDDHHERRPNITEDGCKLVECRGIPLLAIPCNQVLYICVHEISMALWEKFDTPRVSVQKKITDLGIHLHQTTKAQVEILRRERIIGNFRATMITVRDAEKLYDALEYSRRKRGLVKHILKDPGKRGVRAEEYGARKLSRTVRHHRNGTPLVVGSTLAAASSSRPPIATSSSTPQPYRAHGNTLAGPRHMLPRDSPSSASAIATPFIGCALNGTPLTTGIPPVDTARIEVHRAGGKKTSWEGEEERCSYGDLLGLRFDVLFRAGDPEILGGVAGCKDHYIELLQNVSQKDIRSRSSNNSVSRNSSVGTTAVSTQDLDGGTESSAARVRVHTHMDRDNNQHRHNLISTSAKDQAHAHSVTTPNNHFPPAPRRGPPSATSTANPSGSKRKSKAHDPDYQPSAYAVKLTQRNLPPSSQSKRLSSRSRGERESLLSVPSTSTGSGRLNSLRHRHLSSPPLELHELEEGSSEYSGVSRSSSRLQSSTPERFLYLDDSSSEEGEELDDEQGEEEASGEEGDRRGSSDMDSVFIVEHLSSPEMRITVPGKGSTAPDKRIVKTKLRHFAQTTSPQMTALSRGSEHVPHGKHLPLTLDSPPPPSPSPSPLTVSISLDHYRNQSTAATSFSGTPTSYPSVVDTASFIPSSQSQSSSVKTHKRGRGRPPSKNKTRLTALSSFVMKKRASSPPSSLMNSASEGGLTQPPPAKRARMESESDASSTNDGGTAVLGGKSDIGGSRVEGGSSVFTAKRHFRSATGTGSTNYYSILSSSRSPGPPMVQGMSETVDDVKPSHDEKQRQGSPNGYWDMQTEDVGDSRLNGDRGNPHQLSVLVDEDDRYSVASSIASAPTMTNQNSLVSSSKGKVRTSVAPVAGGTTPGPPLPPPQRRGRPPKTPYGNGGNLNSELQSLTSKSKSSIIFDQVFSYYPPKLIVKDGELQPEKSLSVKGLDRSAISGLPEGHPFLSWNLGQPPKSSVTLRGRGRKRKPPKAVHGT